MLRLLQAMHKMSNFEVCSWVPPASCRASFWCSPKCLKLVPSVPALVSATTVFSCVFLVVLCSVCWCSVCQHVWVYACLVLCVMWLYSDMSVNQVESWIKRRKAADIFSVTLFEKSWYLKQKLFCGGFCGLLLFFIKNLRELIETFNCILPF